MTHPALDVEHWDDMVPAEIVIADGHNVTVTVREGHLVIADGAPSAKRVRRVPRIGHPIRTLIILSKHGYVTYEAKAWLHALNIRYAEICGDRVDVSQGRCDWRAVRGQVTRAEPVARYLIAEKLAGQARIADWLGEPRAVKTITRQAATITSSADMKTVKTAEAVGGRIYWSAWRKRLAIPWHARDVGSVPGHWQVFPGRETMRRGIKRNVGASDPLNAMLNYAYTVAASACSVACYAYGLEPSLGMMHTCRDDYHAAAWDLVEAIRPACDERVYDYLQGIRFFNRDWCHETGNGTVVLDAPLTHVIAGWSHDLLAEALPVAREVRRLLCSSGK